MKVDGECLCGAVTFEAEVDPGHVGICHCTDCQTQSGTAFRTIARAAPGSFRLTSGELAVFEKRAESGSYRRLTFCPVCGTSIYGGPRDGEKGFVSLRVGAIRQREQLSPAVQVWCRSAQSWIEHIDELPRIDKQIGVAARSPTPSPDDSR
jgi:hypothetical protein